MLEIEVDHCHLVTVDLYKNDFVSRWKTLFEQTVASCAINQLESFSCSLSEPQSQGRLIVAITTINRYLKQNFVDLPTQIDRDDQQWYNYLHSKFEQLNGTFDRPAKLLMLAPPELKSAIRALNFYVHRLEKRPYADYNTWYISFDKNCYTRLPLEPDDYDHFCDQIRPGQAYIHYAELGKTMIDLYQDGLPIDYSGLRNLHYYSAEISVHVGTGTISWFKDGFRQWANDNSIDIDDRKLGLGVIPIGDARNIDLARQIVYNGNNITNLRITNHGQTI
jgi:hypothetical protein